MVNKSPTTTLLNKFAYLFRRLDKDDSDSAPASQRNDSQPAVGLSLKQRFRLKLRDDAIRTNEFNQLRNVIRDGQGRLPYEEPTVPAGATPTRITGLGTQERSSIIDKIDSAEAHLDMWWSTGSGRAVLTSLAVTTPAPFLDTHAELDDADDLDQDSTSLTTIANSLQSDFQLTTEPAPFSYEEPALTPLENGLRDAALLYAEGEFEAAQAALSALLNDPKITKPTAELLTLSLFDVLRSSGQRERFDALAMEYANRFGRSPAEWFLLAGQEPLSTERDAMQSLHVGWVSPAILDKQAWAVCLAHHAAPRPVCTIDWLPLQHIDAATAPDFAKQVAAWCNSPVELQWEGVDSLMAALKMCRISGDMSGNASGNPTGNAAWWRIQLDVLRILGLAREFDELALEYCVTFEESPPSWKPVTCKLLQSNTNPLVQDFVITQPTAIPDAGPANEPIYALFELSGNITGNSPQALRNLRTASRSVRQIALSCARLGRIDFKAAADLLNWAIECDSRGCELQFIHLPRLVHVYFRMLGMQKLANLSVGSH